MIATKINAHHVFLLLLFIGASITQLHGMKRSLPVTTKKYTYDNVALIKETLKVDPLQQSWSHEDLCALARLNKELNWFIKKPALVEKRKEFLISKIRGKSKDFDKPLTKSHVSQEQRHDLGLKYHPLGSKCRGFAKCHWYAYIIDYAKLIGNGKMHMQFTMEYWSDSINWKVEHYEG
jgi:hypothetical protein